MPTNKRARSDADSWRVKHIFYGLLIYLCILIIFYLLKDQLMGEAYDDSNTPPLLFLFEEFIDAMALISLPLYYVKLQYNDELTKIGLHTRSMGKNAALGIMVGILLWLGLTPLDSLVEYLFGKGPIEQPLLSRLPKATSIFDFAAIILSGCVLTPIAEEVFFRGFTYTIFRKHYRKVTAVILANLVFFSLHVSPWWFAEIFTIGVILTLLFDYSQSLIGPIAAHSVVNLLSLARTYFYGP